MVAYGRQRAREAGLLPPAFTYVEADMRRFAAGDVLPQGGAPPDVAVLFLGTAHHLMNLEQAVGCFSSVRSVLAPNGLLILEVRACVRLHGRKRWGVLGCSNAVYRPDPRLPSLLSEPDSCRTPPTFSA